MACTVMPDPRVLVFLGLFDTGKINANGGYRDTQEAETNTSMFLDGIFMVWERFLKYPMNLPADKNPQVNEPGFCEED